MLRCNQIIDHVAVLRLFVVLALSPTYDRFRFTRELDGRTTTRLAEGGGRPVTTAIDLR